MQESARAALSYIRAMPQAQDKNEFFQQHDLTSTCPRGHTKRRPSAGVTMAVALASIIKGKPIRTTWP